jgi:cytochrome P450
VPVQEAVYWDPFDVEIDTDPHAVWRRMRDDEPLYRNDRYDFWALSRYADVQAASRDPRTYISGQGTVLELMGSDMAASGQIIFMDPPEHTKMRNLVSKAFTRGRIAELEEKIRTISAGLLDPQVGGGGFDFLEDFGAQLPSKVISELLGVSPEDRPQVLNLINTTFTLEPGVGMLNETALNAQFALHAYIEGQLAERRTTPRDDLMTALTEAELEEDGETRRLTDQEAANFALLIVAAGTETVARLLGWTAVMLADSPDQRAELAADASLIPNAVEELLRYEAPSPVQGRINTKDVEWYGQTLPAGSKILLLTGSAGRDERVYAEPDRFNVRRKFDQHVSFGIGAHFCLGAALARLEGKVAIEEVLKRFPNWTVDESRVERLHTSTVRGHKRVPILL